MSPHDPLIDSNQKIKRSMVVAGMSLVGEVFASLCRVDLTLSGVNVKMRLLLKEGPSQSEQRSIDRIAKHLREGFSGCNVRIIVCTKVGANPEMENSLVIFSRRKVDL